jgi:hypothetical protein
MRDRLIELLRTPVVEQHITRETNWEQFVDAVYGSIADNLLANGVTVQEWISVKDRLPDREGWYITMTNATGRCNGILPQEFVIRNGVGKWRYRDRYSPWEITHWQPMPQPPKGE